MKVIFLDIDGVLVIRKTLAERTGLYAEAIAEPRCVENLNNITDATGAKLVLSSAWRFSGENEMRLILKYWGVKAELIGSTPDLTSSDCGLYIPASRGMEIEYWLNSQIQKVESFVILDDQDEMLHLKPYFVQTEFKVGLTKEHEEKAIRILLKEK